jgi:hypothetical protein
MPSKNDFIAAFEKATELSSQDNMFGEIVKALRGKTTPEGVGLVVYNISLDTRGTGDNTRVVEDALRVKLGDDPNRERYRDVVFKNVTIEVKQTTSGFGKLPTDTYGLTTGTEKWYIFLKGPVTRRAKNLFKAWIMRSDHLHSSVSSLNTGVNVIIPGSPTAVNDIASEIVKMSQALASIINARASGDRGKPVRGELSIPRRIGLNRVRFDIKFETLLRKTISEILED